MGFVLGLTFCLTFLSEFLSKDIGDGWGAVIGAAGGASITVFGAYAIGQLERKRSRKEKWTMAREEVAILFSRCGDAIDCYDQFSSAEERVSSVYVDLCLGVIGDINPLEVHHKVCDLRKLINILRQKSDHLIADVEDVVASLPDDFPATYKLNLRA